MALTHLVILSGASQREAQSKDARAQLTLCAAIAAFVAVYLAYDLNRLYALRYGADLGTYLQSLVNLRAGSSWNFGEWRPHLQVHDSWALLVLVPLVALFPRAETLIAVQVVTVALAALPLAAFARRLGVSPPPPRCWASRIC